MGRAKQKLQLLSSEKTRNKTYNKRKHAAIKKAKELSILCDIDVAMIMYPPNSNEPETWPENPNKVKNMITSYKRKKSESSMKNYGLSDFFEERKKKIEDELVKARKKNIEAKYPTWFDELDRLNEGQLREFAIRLINKENVVRAHLEAKKRNILMQQLVTNFEPSTVHYPGGSYSYPYPHPHPHPDPYPYPYPSLEQVQAVNVNHNVMNHDLGWFNEPYEHGMVYNEPNPLAYQWPMVQNGLMQQFGMQEVGPQVNNVEFWAFGMGNLYQEHAIQNENLGVFCDPRVTMGPSSHRE